MCVHTGVDALGGQKRESNLMKLDLQVTVSHPRNQP